MSNSYALCVGINYAGTEFQLTGCINDAEDIRAILPNRYSKELITEEGATKEVILSLLGGMVNQLEAGDDLMFFYSGHGSWCADQNGDEEDGRDECLVDYNLELITDDELGDIFQHRHRHSRILFITDSCHSGTVFGMQGLNRANFYHMPRIKFISPDRLLTGRQLKKAEKLANEVKHQKLFNPGPWKENWVQLANENPGLVHIAGCQDTEYSYDGMFDSRANGALTHALLTAYKDLGPQATIGQIYKSITQQLPTYEYPQQPKLNAVDWDKRKRLFYF